MKEKTVTRTGIWHPGSVSPEYRKGGDNRIIRCALINGDIKNVTYDDVRPDGSLVRCGDSWHSEKWLKKNAMPWKNVITDYWAWVTDIIPI